MFANRVLIRIFGTKERKRHETGEKYIMRSFTSCTPPDIIEVIKPRKI
jgi:hypothetical protein